MSGHRWGCGSARSPGHNPMRCRLRYRARCLASGPAGTHATIVAGTDTPVLGIFQFLLPARHAPLVLPSILATRHDPRLPCRDWPCCRTGVQLLLHLVDPVTVLVPGHLPSPRCKTIPREPYLYRCRCRIAPRGISVMWMGTKTSARSPQIATCWGAAKHILKHAWPSDPAPYLASFPPFSGGQAPIYCD